MPWHSLLTTVVLGLVWLLPLFTLLVLLRFKSRWVLVAGLQVCVTVLSYASMESGEALEKDTVVRLGKSVVAQHEEQAEMFVASSVAASSLAVAIVMIPVGAASRAMVITFTIMLGQAGLFQRAWMSGRSLHAAPTELTSSVPQ